MTRAWAYCLGDGPSPPEIELLAAIDRFGAASVYGRTLRAEEIQAMLLVDNVVTAYRSRAASDNWAEWAARNPAANLLLTECARSSSA